MSGKSDSVSTGEGVAVIGYARTLVEGMSRHRLPGGLRLL